MFLDSILILPVKTCLMCNVRLGTSPRRGFLAAPRRTHRELHRLEATQVFARRSPASARRVVRLFEPRPCLTSYLQIEWRWITIHIVPHARQIRSQWHSHQPNNRVPSRSPARTSAAAPEILPRFSLSSPTIVTSQRLASADARAPQPVRCGTAGTVQTAAVAR